MKKFLKIFISFFLLFTFISTTYSSDIDTDGDGINDLEETTGWLINVGTTSYTGTSDINREDTDFDGLTDLEEKNTGLDPRKRDTDNDGVNDNIDEEITPYDKGDYVNILGVYDPSFGNQKSSYTSGSPDEDRDYVSDTRDKCLGTRYGEIVNSDGCSKRQLHLDNDGDLKSDYEDDNDDYILGSTKWKDGLTDEEEENGWTVTVKLKSGEKTYSVTSDTKKVDSDSDGLIDSEEKEKGTDPRKKDTDGDGLSDSEETGIYDPLNWDSNNDLISDSENKARTDLDNNGDEDKDGILNKDDACPLSGTRNNIFKDPSDKYYGCKKSGNTRSEFGDYNGDGISNGQDTDDDSDGISDNEDKCQFSSNTINIFKLNISDTYYGCEINRISIRKDGDFDKDGLSNSYDTDKDGDGVSNDDDKCNWTKKGVVTGSDGCAIINREDKDLDGIINREDVCPGTELGDSVDTSGILMGCSESQKNQDKDKDGILNKDDACPLSGTRNNIFKDPSDKYYGCKKSGNTRSEFGDYNGDGISNGQDTDDDSDGISDNEDKCPFSSNISNIFRLSSDIYYGCEINRISIRKDGDFDNDGLSNSYDTDKDGDGVSNDDDLCNWTKEGVVIGSDGCSTISREDTDGDGIINREDACPGTELGDSVDTSGILIGCSESQKNQDYDDDGILNRYDACPGTKLGKNQTVIESGENIGCTSQQVVLKIKKNDSDSDGIIDSDDSCPETPYWESHIVDSDGCTIEKDAEKWYNSNVYGLKSNTDKNLDTGDFKNGNDIENKHLDDLGGGEFFSVGTRYGDKGILYFILKIAKDLKNIFLFIAGLFLLILVLKIFFSSNTEEEIGKFKKGLIWTSIGVVIMQIAYSITETLYNRDIEQSTAANFLENIIYPIIGLLELLASLIFIIIAIFAFFRIVTAGGDEEKIKKGKTSVIQAIIGYIVLKLSWLLVSSVYGTVDCKNAVVLGFEFVSNKCLTASEINGTVAIIVDVINWINGFLGIVVVLMIIYAGFNILLSGGDEDKIKKGKSVILYVIIGLLLLTTSYLILTFFILPEANI